MSSPTEIMLKMLHEESALAQKMMEVDICFYITAAM